MKNNAMNMHQNKDFFIYLSLCFGDKNIIFWNKFEKVFVFIQSFIHLQSKIRG